MHRSLVSTSPSTGIPSRLYQVEGVTNAMLSRRENVGISTFSLGRGDSLPGMGDGPTSDRNSSPAHRMASAEDASGLIVLSLGAVGLQRGVTHSDSRGANSSSMERRTTEFKERVYETAHRQCRDVVKESTRDLLLHGRQERREPWLQILY